MTESSRPSFEEVVKLLRGLLGLSQDAEQDAKGNSESLKAYRAALAATSDLLMAKSTITHLGTPAEMALSLIDHLMCGKEVRALHVKKRGEGV